MYIQEEIKQIINELKKKNPNIKNAIIIGFDSAVTKDDEDSRENEYEHKTCSCSCSNSSEKYLDKLPFSVGDVIKLPINDSPELLISEIDSEGNVSVKYFDVDNVICEDVFNIESLKLATVLQSEDCKSCLK